MRIKYAKPIWVKAVSKLVLVTSFPQQGVSRLLGQRVSGLARPLGQAVSGLARPLAAEASPGALGSLVVLELADAAPQPSVLGLACAALQSLALELADAGRQPSAAPRWACVAPQSSTARQSAYAALRSLNAHRLAFALLRL